MIKINLKLSTQEIDTICQGLYIQRSKKIGLNNLQPAESSLSVEDFDELIGKFGSGRKEALYEAKAYEDYMEDTKAI